MRRKLSSLTDDRSTRRRHADQVVALLAAASESRARGQQSTWSSSSSTICSAQPGSEPWDFWLQCVRQNGYDKLPLSEFCQDVLRQVGVSERDCHVWYPGYSREIDDVEAPPRRSSALPLPDRHQLARSRALQHARGARGVPSRLQPPKTTSPRGQGLRRLLWATGPSAMPSPDRARAPDRIRQRVHRQARADPVVQVVRRLRVRPSRRGLRHEDSRCDGVRAPGDHAALRRPHSLLRAGQLLCRWSSPWFRWATASIRGPCGSPTTRCGPKSTSKA